MPDLIKGQTHRVATQRDTDRAVTDKKILVVDDDANMRAVLQFRLGSEGYDVQVTGDGLDALRQISSFHPDLIILDLLLPGMDGLSVLDNVKSSIHTCDVPVIILSAVSGNGYRDRANMLGADRYMSKLDSLRALVSEVRTLLADRGSSEAGRQAESAAVWQANYR